LRAGAITVVERGDGDYDVIDGGTRTIVAQGLNGQVPNFVASCLKNATLEKRPVSLWPSTRIGGLFLRLTSTAPV